MSSVSSHTGGQSFPWHTFLVRSTVSPTQRPAVSSYTCATAKLLMSFQLSLLIYCGCPGAPRSPGSSRCRPQVG